jgi:cell division transport system ATP-binding protein
MIRLENISKVYGNQHALHEVSVNVEDGEFVFLIGPSGSGKTTLLRLLIKDLLPTAGDIFIGDWNLKTLKNSQIHLLRRHVGTVFQDGKLVMDRTVFENIALGLEILGKHGGMIEKDVHDVMALVGLENFDDKFPLQLSAGELQRTAIARAIIGGPKILLADEPTGNLDPETGEEIMGILEEIQKLGTTVIVSTHNTTIVDDMKKRTITLSEGKLVSDELKGKYRYEKKHEKKRKDDKMKEAHAKKDT